ncbi:MAG: hypothetical protein ACXACY_19200 [Candidatus Hodarchaeales archaeon]|jgi:hypothetical protein
MGTKETQNKTTEGPTNNDGSINQGTFEQKLVVLLKTRLKILEAQKKITELLKLEAPTVGQEKALYLDVVKYEGKIEEIEYLIKLSDSYV